MKTSTGKAYAGRWLAKHFGIPLAGCVVGAIAMLTAIAVVPAASRYSVPPTATQIEQALEKAIADRHPGLPSGFRTATLLAVELKRLERVTQFRWIAVTDLRFDFGPPPAAVIGFERRRQGQFRLVLDGQEGQLTLKRFQPMGNLRLLPDV